jgi:hypothetical protein
VPERPDEPRSPIEGEVTLTSLPVSGYAGTVGASAAAAVGLSQTETGLTIPLQQMLSVGVEGYLLGDLESMATEIAPKEIGACGYPMVMAVLAGSELLGALTSLAAQTNRIAAYWDTFMARIDPRYGYLGSIASDLARNGIAHSYLTHFGVQIVRGAPDRHLAFSGGEEIVFDCLKLYTDFRESYEQHARPYILENSTSAQSRLDALVSFDQVKAKSLLGTLPEGLFPKTRADRTELATPTHLRKA